MLKVIAKSMSRNAKVEIDSFVPISIVLSNHLQNPFYWRAKFENDSLLEIGINPKTGELATLTLIMIDRKMKKNYDFDRLQIIANSTEGIPVVAIDQWPSVADKYQDFFLDEETPIKLLLGSKIAQVDFEDQSKIKKWYFTENVFFGINQENYLSAFRISNLSPSEILTLKE